jgi:DNA-binding NarL/FixJ family response regulator
MPSPITVAVTDDDPLQLFAISRKIQDFKNYNVVIQANNGSSLLHQILVADVLPDICVLDIAMPVMNGYTTLPVLKEKYSALRVLILSVYNSVFSIHTMLKLGANGFLSKGADMLQLRDALDSIYTSGYYYSHDTPKELFEKAKRGFLNVPSFSQREKQILECISNNMSYDEIAKKLFISKRTVEAHRNNLFVKFNVNSKVGLIKAAVRSEVIMI